MPQSHPDRLGRPETRLPVVAPDATVGAMTTLVSRRLGVDDWVRYRAVRLAALASDPTAFGSSVPREQGFTTAMWQARLVERVTFIAEKPGEASDTGGAYGLIGIVRESDRIAELVSMWVHPAVRGRGVGDLLVREVLGWSRENGFSEVRLWVTVGNDPAERLYARHGFQRTGATQPIHPGVPGDEFAMAVALPGRVAANGSARVDADIDQRRQ